MFKNFLIIGLRRLRANFLTSIIAIFSLSLGLASGMILYRYIDFQLSYDKFIGEKSVKRVLSRDLYKNYNEYVSLDVLYSREVEKVRSESSIIKEISSTTSMTEASFRIGDEMFFENIFFCEPSFFNITELGEFNGFDSSGKVIVDRIIAEKYFPNGNFSKDITFTYGDGYPLDIVGVVDIPENSHLWNKDGRLFLHIDIFESMTRGNQFKHLVYLESEPGTTNSEISYEIERIIKRPLDSDLLEQEFIVEDFKDIHLFSQSYFLSDIRPLYLIAFLTVLTLGLLTVSIINCVSILTTQFVNRGREAGIRVVFGSFRGELAGLFISESLLITVFATIIAMALSELLLPLFSDLIGLNLYIEYSLLYLVFIAILIIATALIIGFYPSYYLSSLNCVDSLKGKRLIRLGKFKRITVISQFFFSTLLLIASMVINNEINHLERFETGLESENILYIYPGYELDNEPSSKLESLKDSLLRLEGVESVSYSTFYPFFGGPMEDVEYEGSHLIDSLVKTDREYFKTFGVEIVEGSIVEGSVIAMESVLAERVLYIGDYISVDGVEYQISGIVNDYMTGTPLYENFKPRYHLVDRNSFYFQAIKTDRTVDLAKIKRIWQDTFPNRAIDIMFLDNEISANMTPDIVKTLKRVVNLSFYISIFISFLGLFGITLHSINEKSKEISIRKVLGGEKGSILVYFYKKSIKNIVIGIFLGVPMGLLAVSQGFAAMGYPFPIHDPLFIGLTSGLYLTIGSSVVVGVMLLNSLRKSPSEALRYE